MTDELSRLRSEFQALTERVDVLEAQGALRAPDRPRASPGPGALPEGAFWALEGLQARLTGAASAGDVSTSDASAGDGSAHDGAVMLVGSLTLPSGAPVAWQQSASTAGLLEADWGDRAAVFGALAHPVRIELLRHMLNGVHATADLAAIDGLGTTGQLHHHLRQLVAAGWVRQSGRGSYEIPAARIVPLFACVVGVER